MNRLPDRTTVSRQLDRISRAIPAARVSVALALWIPLAALGQMPARNLSGTVKSASGSPLPTAQISVKNLASGSTVSTKAGEDGSYKLANLAPGNYEVSASAPGFISVRAFVAINADQDQVANLTLSSGSEQRASSTVSGVVNSQSVLELPLNGRSASDLAALEPGVETARTQSSGQGKYGFGTQMTISGGRPRQNDARLDGISVNDYANGSPGSALGVNLGVDAVEQFTVLTSNYPAQVGPSYGGLLGPGDTGIYTFSGQQVTPENYFTTRVDQKFSAKDTLSATYMFDSGTVRQPDELNNKRAGYDSRRQFFTVSEAHTFNPHLLNFLRFGIYRVVASTGLTFPSGNPAAADPSFATVPGHNAAAIIVPGITSFTGGIGAPTNYHFHWTTIQTYDDFTWSRGIHSLKFGVGVERIRDNELGVSSPNGEFLFDSLSGFLTNHPI